MPIKKYKTFEEAETDLWNLHPDKEWIKRTFRLFRLLRFRKKIPVKKGITKFKTIEEAQSER
jgi:hypothetical protein